VQFIGQRGQKLAANRVKAGKNSSRKSPDCRKTSKKPAEIPENLVKTRPRQNLPASPATQVKGRKNSAMAQSQ